MRIPVAARFVRLNWLSFLLALLVTACTEQPPPTAETAPCCDTHSLRADSTAKASVVYVISQPDADANLHVTQPENSKTPPEMVFVPGGITPFGSNTGLGRERPEQLVRVAGFFMDIHPVTVAQFRQFVQATKYVTMAEAFGDAGVFDTPREHWKLVKGANWEFPRGPDQPKAPDNHPVTQVCWSDAMAYCKWAGKRLPTEVEWEYAAREAGTVTTPYSWGDELQQNGRFMANTWNGTFPSLNTAADGFQFTSPVGRFGANRLGLQDMAGNVWEWCADWYLPYPGSDNPEAMPLEKIEKAHRGGSFMCHASYCHGYRVTARAGTTPETSLFHLGFRAVKDL